MRSPMRRFSLTILACMILVAAAACSSDSSSDYDGPHYEDGRPIFQGTASEHQIAVFECLADAGFDITIRPNPNGDGYGFTLNDESRTHEEVTEQMEACRWEVGWPRPWDETDENRRIQYEHRVKDYECLTAAGYDISDPPSFATFLENARNHGDAWQPWEEFRPVPPAAALEACPRDSDAWIR